MGLVHLGNDVNTIMIIDTQDYNVFLDIDDNLDVIFCPIGDADYNLLSEAINKLNIRNESAVIMLWATVGRFYSDSKSIDLLNDFYNQIKNPMVLFSGSLNADTQSLNVLYQPVNLFQYIAKIEQFSERSITTNKNKKFLYTTTKNYFSRAYILQHLINNGLIEQGTVSYKCLNDSRYIESYLNVSSITDACKTINHLLPFGGLPNDPHLDYRNKPESAITDSYLSIITETFFDGPIFLSEKIYYAMLYNHFFVYAGPANSLKYLKSQGFKTFSHVIDESYDQITDPVQRILAVTKSLHDFLNKPVEEIERLYIENIEIFNHNRKLVLQTEITPLINSALTKSISLRNNV